MRGVHAPLNHIATAVVIIRVVVAVVVIIVVRVVATVAESEAVPEVAVVESSTISIVESATIVESTLKAATMETTITESASHATVEAAAFHAATPEAATVKTSTSEATTMAAAKTATAHAASVPAAEAATSAAMTATATTSARQRHGWRNQADARNCQQRDNRLAQHHHSPSEIPLPTPSSLQVAIVAENRYRFRQVCCSSLCERFQTKSKVRKREQRLRRGDASCSTDDLLKMALRL
jgi:hypothetical protein